MEVDRLPLVVPSFFVETEPPTPSPMPIPGYAEPEDVFRDDDPDPPFAFLRPDVLLRETEMSVEQDGQQAPRTVQFDDEFWANYLDIFPVRETVEHIFSLPEDPVDDIMASLKDPFQTNPSGITWTFVRRVKPQPAKHNTRRVVQGIPWSIMSVGELHQISSPGSSRRRRKGDSGSRPAWKVKKNYIYDGEGRVRAEVDFGCSANPALHVHQLIPGQLDHSTPASEHHCLSWRHVPWFFVAFPDRRKLSEAEHVICPNVSDVREGDFVWCPIDHPCDLDLFLDEANYFDDDGDDDNDSA